MKILSRILAVILFLIFFGFALKNTHEAVLKLFWDVELRGPMVLLILGFFIGGAVLGILAMTPTLFRHRRELNRQKKLVAALQQENETLQQARNQQPQPASIVAP